MKLMKLHLFDFFDTVKSVFLSFVRQKLVLFRIKPLNLVVSSVFGVVLLTIDVIVQAKPIDLDIVMEITLV